MSRDAESPGDAGTADGAVDPSRIRDAEMVAQFVRDLRAANRLKSYLLATGAELPEMLVSGLADLSARTLGDSKDLL